VCQSYQLSASAPVADSSRASLAPSAALQDIKLQKQTPLARPWSDIPLHGVAARCEVDILYGCDDEDDIDPILLNLVASTIPKRGTFKLLRW
jgi:hypothetical protein